MVLPEGRPIERAGEARVNDRRPLCASARGLTAVRRENGAAEDTKLEEGDVIEALGALEPVWDELYPAEQARILRLLIERIDVARDGISVTLHAAGIRSLVAELVDEEAPAPATSEPLLEAAE
jgi:site-specific DNA recombinase